MESGNQEQLKQKDEHIRQLQQEIEFMKSSKFWKMRNAYVGLRKIKLNQVLAQLNKSMEILMDEGIRAFIHHFKYLRKLLNEKYLNRRVSNMTTSEGGAPKHAARVSIPHAEYAQWVAQQPPLNVEQIKKEIEGFKLKPTISIITPVYNTDEQWLRECIESVQNQIYPHWELCLTDDASPKEEVRTILKEYEHADQRIKVHYAKENGGISAASNHSLQMATGAYVALLDHDDSITPDALYEVVQLINKHPDADMVYSDEDKLEVDGTLTDPFFKPDWAPEYFLSCMYTSHLGTYRKTIVDNIGGFRSEYDKSQDYDLALRVIDHTDKIYHIPKVLYHWRKIPGSTAMAATEKDMSDAPAIRAVEDYLLRNNIEAEVIYNPITTYHRVKYPIQGEPLVSILLPTNGKIITTDSGKEINLLINCLKSIERKTTYKNYEIVIGHNGNLTPETMEFVQQRAKKTEKYTVEYYKYEEPFNFANKLNFIAKHAKGEYFLILNDDIEVISPEWMSAMLEYAQQDDIGVVGAKLYYPDGRIQHAGVVMGIGGGASHVFLRYPHDDPGYFSMTKFIRNWSVVTGACSMTKASLFKELGGLDEQFRIDYNDVDYNLRLREKGYRVVFTPFAELTHHESVSIGSRVGQIDRPEERLLRTRWADVIARDPYYNPNLTLKDINFELKK